MITLHDAVRSVYPEVRVCYITEDNAITAFDINEQNVPIDVALVTAKLAELQSAETATEQAQATAKASALAKLTALGLSEDEVKALVG